MSFCFTNLWMLSLAILPVYSCEYQMSQEPAWCLLCMVFSVRSTLHSSCGCLRVNLGLLFVLGDVQLSCVCTMPTEVWVVHTLTHFACCGGYAVNIPRYHCDLYVCQVRCSCKSLSVALVSGYSCVRFVCCQSCWSLVCCGRLIIGSCLDHDITQALYALYEVYAFPRGCVSIMTQILMPVYGASVSQAVGQGLPMYVARRYGRVKSLQWEPIAIQNTLTSPYKSYPLRSGMHALSCAGTPVAIGSECAKSDHGTSVSWRWHTTILKSYYESSQDQRGQRISQYQVLE